VNAAVPGLREIRLAGGELFLAIDGLTAESLRRILDAHRENRDPSRCLKRNLGTVVTRVPCEGFSHELVVKEVPVRPLRRLLYLLGGSSPFRKEFESVRRLQATGVRVPRAIACTIRPRGASEFLVTELIEGCVPLRDLLWLGERVIRDRDELAALFTRVGAWLRSIHDLGVWQRDMKPSNVLVRGAGPDWGGADLILIDLTAVRVLGGPIDETRRVRNLAQLLDLTADLDGPPREPLLRSYLGGESPAGEVERLARLVDSAIESRRDYRERQCGFRHVDGEHLHHQN
jgi:tRNA A-37 threonylcarbamoyl transferase component Bud32